MPSSPKRAGEGKVFAFKSKNFWRGPESDFDGIRRMNALGWLLE